MAITIDETTQVITVEQSDLTFVSGAVYDFETNDFRLTVGALLDDERYIWMPAAFTHFPEVTIVGVVQARSALLVNGYSLTFENLAYSARFQGSNNNFFDVDNGILNPSPLVTVISGNSAGLQIVSVGSGLDPGEQAELKDIHQAHFNRRKLDKGALTETLYEDDKSTPKVVFDTNADVADEGLTELTPQ